MGNENEQKGKSGNEMSDKANELIEKGKELADKAEGFFTENVNRFKSSDAFGKISEAFEKAKDIMEDKAEEFHSGEMGAKFEAFKENTEDQASVILNKLKDAGRKIGDQVDETLDVIKGKKDQPNNQGGSGI